MIVYGGFLPAKKYGGPVVSIENLVNFFDHSFWIVTRDHEWKTNEKLTGIHDGWNIFNDHTKVIYLEDSEHTKKRYISIIQEINPDIIYINGFYSIQMYIPMIKAARMMKIPILIAPRGTLNKNAMAIKSLKKYPYVYYIKMILDRKKSYFQSTSDEETMRISDLLGAQSNHIFEVENVPSIPKQKQVLPVKEVGKLKCCFFARICEKKNLLFALKVLKNTKSEIEFCIFGNVEENEYWDKCKQVIEEMPKNVTVRYMGEYNHEDVFQLMSHNHVFFFPTLSENYGHVIVEAMLSGLPAIISDQTPWNDINMHDCGAAIPLIEENLFVEAIERYAMMNNQQFEDERTRLQQYINEKLKLPELRDKYSTMFLSISQPNNSITKSSFLKT